MLSSMSRSPATHRIALLFNANKIYDREVISGIGAYLSSTRVVWDLYLEDDFRSRLDCILDWKGDGIIADFDDPAVQATLARSTLPVVAVGGSYEDESRYPAGVPYVATDNFKLVKIAFDHLIEVGLQRFAMYSLPEAPSNRWAQEREAAFRQLLQNDRLIGEIHRGMPTSGSAWNTSLEQLTRWLKSVPKPIGIIAVTDARARHVLQACIQANISVPEEVAIIGIDNDPLTRTLARIPLSSVIQGTEQMGRIAAELLHRQLVSTVAPATRILVPPVGINVQASSKHEQLGNPYVMRARHFIRQYAGQGIKTAQIAEYVGISRTTLENYFKRELSCTVHDEILRFKLRAAQELLSAGELPIAEIAVRCGFTSLQYLYAVFKREVGCTPKEYIERLRHEQAGL
jgi:LacI family transcriptional regulator